MNHIDAELLLSVFQKHQTSILNEWINEQLASVTLRADLLKEADLRRESKDFLDNFADSIRHGRLDNILSDDWSEMRRQLAELSRSRGTKGFSPSETATFVFSFKQPVSNLIQKNMPNAEQAMQAIVKLNAVIDKLGLFTLESHLKVREELIMRQQEEMLELSTPVVKLWDGILALPMIGTLDSSRTQSVMENLLQKIVDTEAQIAIIDITGVLTVDTLVAQHLLKTVAATRLMGADCIISGIRPQIAQTMVHLAIDLSSVITRATLADAFSVALTRVGQKVVKREN